VGGRWYLYSNLRWVGFSFNYGAQTENHSQNGGVGTEPQILWHQLGPYLPDGATVHDLRIAGYANALEVTGIDLRIYHQTGPWAGTWNNAGDVTRTLLHASDNLDFSGGNMRRYNLNINAAVSGEGYLLMMVRPIGTLSSTRFLLSSANVQWSPA